MKNGLVIADSGPIFSLALIDKLNILTALFDDVKIPQAVWNEITYDKTKPDYQKQHDFFKDKTHQILSIPIPGINPERKNFTGKQRISSILSFSSPR